MFYRPARARIAATNRREWNYHKKALRNHEIPEAQEANLKIALFGLFGLGNYGNDGSLEAMLLFLRKTYPDAELTCICGYPRKVERDFQIAALPIRLPSPHGTWFRVLNRVLFKLPRAVDVCIRTFNQVSQFDVVVVPGTGILEDYGDRPWQDPFSFFMWCLASKLRGVKFAFVCIGAGPINNSANRWLMKSAARLATFRSFRDEGSKQFSEEMGVDTKNDRVFPDLAFSLPEPHGPRPPRDHLTVGVGIMDYHGWYGDSEEIYETYVGKISDFVIWLLDSGHHVRLLTGQAVDQGVIEDILRTIDTLRPDQSDDRIAARPVYSLCTIMREMQKTDVAVLTRFHNLICAMKVGVPFISIGYSDKHRRLAEEAGLGEFCQEIEAIDIQLLKEQFAKLAADREKYREGVMDATSASKIRLIEQEQILESEVFSRRVSALPSLDAFDV